MERERTKVGQGSAGTSATHDDRPRVNQEDPCRTSVTESKKVCSNRKGSTEENGDVRSKRPCSESSKNLSNSLRVKKKLVIDPIVRQVTRHQHRHWTCGVMRVSEKINWLS
ncbi:integrase_H2C2 domain-containing protein [Trichonephila clavipes]|nr:integrase_H2C2 domain-containing protein [Trichonephila clavipes]